MPFLRSLLTAAAVSLASPALAANPLIHVTSGVDNGSDGARTTLREAFARAASRPGPDVIVIDAGTYGIALEDEIKVDDPDPVTVSADPDDDGIGGVYIYVRQEQPVFEITGRGNLTVIGLLFYTGSAAGALGNGGTAGAFGTSGAAGESHDEILGDNKPSASGGAGTGGSDGFSGGPAGTPDPVAAMIVNRGKLALVRSSFGTFYVQGGPGGLGGGGGRGGNGGSGGGGGDALMKPYFGSVDASVKDGGNGGAGARGGNGGAGGKGGKGGDAAGAILNRKGGVLTLTDVSFGGRSSYFGLIAGGGEVVGGAGGRGGSGGNGGSGGSGGYAGAGGVKGLPDGTAAQVPPGTFTVNENGVTRDPCNEAPADACGVTAFTYPGDGGKGGDGGSAGPAGVSGAGGDAAGAILNFGKVSGEAAVAGVYKARGGDGGNPSGFHGFGGSAGPAGGGGLHPAGVYFRVRPLSEGAYIAYAGDIAPGSEGIDGKAGTDAPVRAVGKAGKGVSGILTKGAGAISTARLAKSLVFVHDLGRSATAAGGQQLSFNVIRFGEVSKLLKVKWKVLPGSGGNPVDAGDFKSGRLPSGTTVLKSVPASATSDAVRNTVRVDLELNGSAAALRGKSYRLELQPLAASSGTLLGTSERAGKL